MKKKLGAILLTLALVVGLSIPMAIPVAASPATMTLVSDDVTTETTGWTNSNPSADPLNKDSYGGSWSTATDLTTLPGTWYNEALVAPAEWVSSEEPRAGISGEDQWRLFREEFTIPSGAVNISGSLYMAADNDVIAYLNGTSTVIHEIDDVYGPVPAGGPYYFNSLHGPYSFVPSVGSNTLYFVVRNWQWGGANPTGLLYTADVEYEVPEEKCADLMAGQHINVGTVCVMNDGDSLYVEYQTTGGWEMTETHLHVAETSYVEIEEEWDTSGIPQKKGNPPPGQFDYSDPHGPVTDYTYTIDLGDWEPCTDLVIAAHAVVQKVTVITASPYYASSVVSFNQGLTKGGGAVRWQRSTPEQGLAFETGENEFNFFSLGFGGWIIVEFDCPIRNGEGDDVQIIEDTWGAYPLETADVYASQDGNSWQLLGEADNTTRYLGIHTISQFDLGDLPWAKYIKIVDTADPNDFAGRPDADGFDLNAVVSLQDCIEIEEETAWGYCEPNGGEFPGKNWATYFTYHVQ